MTELALIALASVAVLMLALWAIHFRIHNAAIVDAGWAAGLAIIGIIYTIGGTGWMERRVLIGGMSGLWGMRLAAYLLKTRVIGHEEEGRYQEIRRNWQTNIGFKFLLFFEGQALLCVVLSVPFLLAAMNPTEGFQWFEYLGVAIWAISILGESLADGQLAAFKRKPGSKGHTCREGLWRYSRHPNYFFEWFIWIGYALVGVGADYGWLGFLSQGFILYFLLRVTGIPATEAQAVRSRGDDYRDYQRTTSAFVPWFPKEFPKESPKEHS
jgi:steroid 5-alpha reductase family enzyme